MVKTSIKHEQNPNSVATMKQFLQQRINRKTRDLNDYEVEHLENQK